MAAVALTLALAVALAVAVASRYLVKSWHQIRQTLPGGGRGDGAGTGDRALTSC